MQPLHIAALATLALLSLPCRATTLNVLGLTPTLNARVTVNCEAAACGGPATIELLDPQGRVQQTLKSEDFVINPKGMSQSGEAHTLRATEQDELIAQDFNFDGSIDLAIRNGSDAPYGGPTHDVYVYQATRRRFVPSEDLTTLARAGMGMFSVDPRRKRLTVFEKSGCCWHKSTEYGIRPGQGLYETASLEESIEPGGDWVKVTTISQLGTKTNTKVRRYRVKDYYKRG